MTEREKNNEEGKRASVWSKRFVVCERASKGRRSRARKFLPSHRLFHFPIIPFSFFQKNMQRPAAATPSRMAPSRMAPSMSTAASKPALPARRRGVSAAAAKRGDNDGDSVKPAQKNVSSSRLVFFFSFRSANRLSCSLTDARSSWNFDALREMPCALSPIRTRRP